MMQAAIHYPNQIIYFGLSKFGYDLLIHYIRKKYGNDESFLPDWNNP